MTGANKIVESNTAESVTETFRSSSTLESRDNQVTMLDDKKVNEQKNFASTKELVRFTIVMIGIVIAMFMMSLNSTVVAPAMSAIATELNGLSSQTWIATAYLVAINAFQPLSGKFSDIFGRKSVYLFGIFFFFAGSLINALSTNISMLIAGRTIQGFGGGGVMSMTYIIVSEVSPIPLRPRFQSMLSVVYGIANVAGPLIGGGFVDHVSWHWDFWLNVILAAVAFIVIFFYLNETQSSAESSFIDKLKRIDWLGTLFSIGFIVCLLLALNWGSSYGWSSAHSIGPFVAAGVSFIALIICEGWVAKEPLLPARVILNPACTVIYGYMMTLGLTFIGTLYFGPIYYQAVFAADSTSSGLRLIPFMVCLIAGSVGCGFLLRKFPRTKFYLILGSACNLLGYGLFYTVNEGSNWGQQAGYLAFSGFAFGISQQNCILSVQSSVERRDIAVATSSNNFFMMLASSIGIVIYQTMYQALLKSQFVKLPTDVLAVANEYGALKNYLFIKNLPVDVKPYVVHAYSEAIHTVFLLPIAAAAIGFILTLFCRDVRYGVSQPQERDEEVAVNEKA
ncbi:major facilitator superfamily-domain-containing protein [Gilbertella persicaria]|uniref:major facilitator superfamily-domain-containing protein n=1 Tax=Gilbertella persicaria TaxID=101096 RepID=UPI0022211F4D|nr:major facilitator superfamily-domain-containing protein [Gilbertella persicaria]KAI8079563.1 major facilitator superfamily-domain-containing protein [Gilbertella persicaria]